MTGPQLAGAIEFAKLTRERFPGITIVWGGYHPSILTQQTIQQPYVDVVVRGQGELTFVELMDALERRSPLRDILGITYKDGGELRTNPDRPFASVDAFPPVPYHLIDMERIIRENNRGYRSLQYVSSQGCPFQCGFCAEAAVYKQNWSGRSAAKVVDEIAELCERYRLDNITFVDANFFVDLRRVRDICQGIIDRHLTIRWGAVGRADQLLRCDDSLLHLIQRSGCHSIGIGAESGSQEVLDLLDKRISSEMLVECAELLGRANLSSYYSFIVGLPEHRNGAPPPDFWQTLELAKRVKAINPEIFTPVFFYLPYPGSTLYQRALEHGFDEPDSLEEWADCSFTEGPRTSWLTEDEKEVVKSCTTFYFPLAYPNKRIREAMRSGVKSHAVRLLHRLALWRCQHSFYKLTFEWRVAQFLERLPRMKGAFSSSQY